MVKWEPVVNAILLEEAVNIQFDVNINNLRELLFGEDIAGDYHKFFFNYMEHYIYPIWQNEEEIRLRNLVRAYLQDIFPDRDWVLIN